MLELISYQVEDSVKNELTLPALNSNKLLLNMINNILDYAKINSSSLEFNY
jgi:hypothetical protein